MDKIYDNGIVREMTDEEIAEKNATINAQRIDQLKAELASTDYKAIKYAEGWLTEEEYAPIKAERQAIRDEINALELQAKEELA